MQEKFNPTKYKNDYKKENYKQFSTVLKKDEMEELNKLMKKLDMNRAEFLRYAIKKIKKQGSVTIF